ncbi:MAG: DNA polymerase III subunit delta' [Lutisporaceae bacterium]
MMNFDSIIGQSVLAGSLKRAVKEDLVANAYIFSGSRGSGKSMAAEIFAKALNCRGEGVEKPCDNCTSCKKLESGNHPNIDIIKPSGASIKIKQIREVIAKVSKKPFENGYKVLIIDEADKMTQDAQDAFLKTLEEPPANTVFILLAENQNSLLPTVVSRCQVFYLKKVAKQQIESFLLEKFSYDIEQISFAATSANGIIGRAIEMLNDQELQKLRKLHVNFASNLNGGSYIELATAASELAVSKEEVVRFLDFMLSWYRDILIIKQGCEEQLLVNSDNADIIERQAEVLDEKRIYRIIDAIKRTISYVNHNVGIKNSIDSMILNIMEVYNG